MNLTVLTVLCLALWAGAARADESCGGAGAVSRVHLTAQMQVPDAALLKLVQRHLTAALAARGIGLCTGMPEARALAQLTIVVSQSADGSSVQVIIRVGDAVTQKRSERSMDLSSLPEDSRPLSIASSADELLRASWAELAMPDAPRAEQAPPPVVLRAVASSLRAPRRNELGAELSALVLHWRTGLGGRLRFAHYFDPHWGLALATGASFGLERRAQHGTVRADTLDLELAGSYALTEIGARVGAALDAAIGLSRISFVASANEAGEASSFADWGLSSTVRARGWLGAGPVRGTLSLGVSYGLRPTRASDEGKTVTSTGGVGAELLLGACAFL